MGAGAGRNFEPRRWDGNGPRPMSKDAPELVNDLETPVEVTPVEMQRGWDWKVIYPCDHMYMNMSKLPESRHGRWTGHWTIRANKIAVRLREAPEVAAVLEVDPDRRELLLASQDFGLFSERAVHRDDQLLAAAKRENDRRNIFRQKQQTDIHADARQGLEKTATSVMNRMHLVLCLVMTLLVVVIAIPPSSAAGAAILGLLALLTCCGINFYAIGCCLAGSEGWEYDARLAPEQVDAASGCILLSSCFGFLGLVIMMVQHGLNGYWWTLFIVLPGIFGFCVAAFVQDPTRTADRAWTRAKDEAKRQVLERTIVFEGSVLEEEGRSCVCSWPGKYEGAWDALVQNARAGSVSAAVVFLPHGTKDYGEHDCIPSEERLHGDCWCVPLYGEKKEWGCRWWSHWIANIETAVKNNAKLEVYHFVNAKGMGKVQSFATVGEENLRRERLSERRREFESSQIFRDAVNSGLQNLSKKPEGDGSSPYSREVNRLFLEWLPQDDREFLVGSEGLGNSQKAEVAWLERKGYNYTDRDVADWLPKEQREMNNCFTRGAPASGLVPEPCFQSKASRIFPPSQLPPDLPPLPHIIGRDMLHEPAIFALPGSMA